MSQPPSFQPERRRLRPESSGAHRVGKQGRARHTPSKAEQPALHEPAATPQPHGEQAAAPDFLGGEVAPTHMPPSYAPAHNSARPQAPDEASHGNVPRPQSPHTASPHAPSPAYAPAGSAAASEAPSLHEPALTEPKRRRFRKRWLLLIPVAILIAAIAWPAYLIHLGNEHLTHTAALPEGTDTPGTTYLIAGSDKRSADGINDGAEGQRSDSLLLLQVPESGTTSLISIPRDSWVEIPGHGEGKINSSYSLGGAPLLIQTVQQLTGMKIDHYIEVSMGGVAQLTDAVGGVNLCYDRDVNDAYSGMMWQAGCHDADGRTALAFSRMRYSDPLGDLGRTARQRQVVSKIISKAASKETFLSPSRQKELVIAGASNLTTDPKTGIADIARAALGLRDAMSDKGVMGTPPISSTNYRQRKQSAVQLNPEATPAFFKKMMNGTLTSADIVLPGQAKK